MSMGRYTPSQVKKVISAYMGEMRKEVENRNEFREDFFGSFRYTSKGFRNMKRRMRDGLVERSYLSDMTHEMSRLKKKAESSNAERWEAENRMNGYMYLNNEKQREFSNKKVREKLMQMSYFRRKLFEKHFLKKK